MTTQSTDDLILEIKEYISTYRNELEIDDINSLNHSIDLVVSNNISPDMASILFERTKVRNQMAGAF